MRASRIRVALEPPPANLQALLREAVQHHRAGRRAEAERLYRQILSIDPGQLDAMQLLGVLANEAGRHEEAIGLISAAIDKSPNIASWHSNLGGALLMLNRSTEAIASFERALTLDPNSAAINFNVGNAFAKAKRLEEAVHAYQRAADFAPSNVDIQRTLAEALYELGDTRRAIARMQRAIAVCPPGNPRVRLKLFDATMMPLIYDSAEEIAFYRRRVAERIESLRNEGCSYSLDEPPQTLFRLAYQGLDDVDVMRSYAALMRPPDVAAPKQRRRADGRIRLGFISAHFRNHTIGRLNARLIERLSRDRFELVALSVAAHRGAIADRYRAAADRYITLPNNDLAEARRMILDLDLDVLNYTDLGMDRFTYALAFSRLAPIQTSTWGHPITHGGNAIDFFISSMLLEDASAQMNYVERLTLLPSLTVCYDRPRPPDSPRTRADFGLSDDAHIYGCLQTLYKFHPEFDAILGEILRRDPTGVVLLIAGKVPQWQTTLMARFVRTIPDVADRIRWLPGLSEGDFFSATALCDVMLDTIYYGGFTTSAEALAFGVPIVTLPSKLLPARFTQAFYRMMQMDECTVSTPQEYVELAVAIGTNPERRRALSQKILSRNEILFDNTSGVRELEAFFEREVDRELKEG